MSAKALLLSGNVATVAGVVVAAGVSIFALVASGVLDGTENSVPTAQTVAQPVAIEPATPAAEVADTAAVSEAAQQPESKSVETDGAAAELAPTFDLVRVDAQGNTVVAGTATAGGVLAILLDGLEISKTQAGGDGKFAAILAIEPSATPRVLSLIERKTVGDTPSQETVIIAPVQVSVAAAQIVEETDAHSASADDVEAVEINDQNQNDTAQSSSPEGQQPGATDIAPKMAKVLEAPQLEAPQSESIDKPVLDVADAAEGVEPNVVVAEAIEQLAEASSAEPSQSTTEPTAQLTTQSTQKPKPAAQTSTEQTSKTSDPVQSSSVAKTADEATQKNEALEAAPKAPAILVSDAEGVRVVQPAAAGGASPEVLAAVAIDSISYSDSGSVVVAGRGGAQNFVRLYLNNGLSGDGDVSTDGQWQLELDGIEAGVYTMRVDELNGTGDVVSRVQTPFKREAPDVVARVQAQSETSAADASTTSESAALEPDAEASADADQAQPNVTRVPAVRVVTVQPGSTLWAIARDRYGEGVMYVRVFEANKDKIRDPHLIYPGQVFAIPE